MTNEMIIENIKEAKYFENLAKESGEIDDKRI